MRRSVFFSFIALAVLAAATSVAAQIVPQGGIVPVGSMQSSQRDVTTLPSGEFVVVWAGDYSGFVLGTKVIGGTPGTPFQISNYSYFTQEARVDSDSSGNFWVVWKESSSIGARGFDSATSPLPGAAGSPFQVSGSSTYSPQVGVRKSAGGFVATYDDYMASYTRARGFDGTGTESFAAVDATYASNTKLAVDPAGNFLVVWSGDYLEATPFAPDGTMGSTFQITGPPPSSFDAAALGTGQFVVAWSDFTGSPYYTVSAQLTSTSATVGSPITVAGIDNDSSVAVSGNASYFVVVWQEEYFGAKTGKVAPLHRTNARLPFALGDVSGQAFTSSGSPLGTPQVFNSGQPAVGSANPAVSMNSGNQFTVLWNNFSSAYAQAAVICNGTPTAPALLSPITGATSTSPVTFSWSSVGAANYEFWAAVGGAPTLQGSTAATSLAIPLPVGTGSWFVIADFGGPGCTAQSITETFEVCALPPTLSSPILGATVSSPVTFAWSAVSGATSYDVFVGVGAAPTLAGNTTGTTFGPLALADGAGTWYVVANLAGSCGTAQSATESFTVSTCPVLSPPTLVSPPNGATVESPVTFQWSAVTDATAYEVFVGVGTSPTLAGTTSATSLSLSLPAGTGDWYVVAKSSVGCPTASSSTQGFTVKIPFVCPTPSTPNLTAPEDGAEFEVGEFVRFEWTAAPNASRYDVWGSVDGAPAKIIGSTANTFLNRQIAAGTTEWYVIASFGPSCETATTTSRTIKTKDVEPPPPPDCGLKDAPLASIVGEATTGETYTLIWDALDGAIRYHVQESSSETFIGGIISEQTVAVTEAKFSHPDLTTPTPFYYRVAGITECDDGDKQGPYSRIVRVVGLPKPEPSSTNPQVVTEFGNEDFVETFLFIPGFGEAGKTASAATFSASSNEPWLTVSPASGPLPPEGTTVKLLAAPKDLGLGANTATVTVTRDDGLGKATSGSTTKGVPVAVSLVTPVTPIGKTAGPPENSLIIPAVANVTGINSKWFSDVKITNRSGQLINYQLNFSATDQSGTVDGKQTKVTIRPGQTVALDDVVRQWYGLGDLADGTNGALEIRPINFTGKVGPEAAPMLATVASSRTFTRQENSLASYGQFIPAVPFSGFLKAGVENSLLMMQQVSQTASLRTNFGLVEGAGKDVNVMLTAYDREGTKLGEFPVSLKAGEHKQLNSLLALNNISVEDGRMTVQIVSGDGAVTSYASVVSSGTGDPSLVPGVNPANLSAKKYVLPGVADLRIGDANWRSDIRIFNPNQAPESVNVFFYPQGETTPLGPVEIQIQPGQISVLPGVVESLFGRQDLGGALHVVPISGQATSLVITGETYDVSELGKYGQFIPAVTEENAIGVGSPGLEVMQVEESAQFRTNLGLAEVTGQQATVQIQLTVPNSLIAPTRTVTLGGNEFQQLNGIVRQMTGGRDVYNGRLTVRVVGGTGKITAYGSTVDNQTRDATFSAGQ